MNAKGPIDFWFDFTSPYSYIASEWIDALAARHGRQVRWHAMLLGATFQAAELRSPVAYPLKRDYVLRDFARSARFEGVPYVQPQAFPVSTLHAARLFWSLEAANPEQAKGWSRCALRAYFTRGVNVSDADQLAALAADFGIADAAARWSDPAAKERLRQENEAAIAAGIFGAPTFVVDGEPFWGNDRKAQLAAWLDGSLVPR
jgi:2-hydroxychromene-2-carboxylate isomerase